MVELHMSFWKLLGYAGALYLAAVLVIRGQLLKHRLRRELIGNTRRIRMWYAVKRRDIGS